MFTSMRNEDGVTLIETCVVAALLSIGAATCAWSLMFILPDLRLKATTRDLKTNMQLARLAAIRENVQIVSEFFPGRNCYIIYKDDGGGDRTKANNYLLDEGETILKSVLIHPSVRINRSVFGAVVGKFAFNSRGSIDGLSGGVYFQNETERYRGVAFSRIGKMTIKQSSDGKTWQPLQ